MKNLKPPMRSPTLVWTLGVVACQAITLGKVSADAQGVEPKNTTAISFVRDVLPVLTRAGCNASSCHSKPQGQNGFKLSVFAYDPKADYDAIVSDNRGRRVAPGAPEQSLILQKASLTLPHEGGKRLEHDSVGYNTVVRWIQQGSPFQLPDEPDLENIRVTPESGTYKKDDAFSLQVDAIYGDGSARDVTALSRFKTLNEAVLKDCDEHGHVIVGQRSGEGAVVVQYMGQVALCKITVPVESALPAEAYAKLPRNNFIDDLAYKQFQRLGLFPSDLCTDAEFLRRASLDLTGLLPTPEQAKAFLGDSSENKRAEWVKKLLEHPAWSDHWAVKWADLFRPNPDRAGVKSVYMLDQWLRESFRKNKPYDQFARDVLLSEGSTHRFGPSVIFRDRRTPADRTTIFSQIFLGVRMECARCHHHPNEKWSQEDFYQLAAYFGEVKQKGTGISPPISGGAEVFYHEPGGEVRHPVTNAVMAAKPPDGPKLAIPEGQDPRRVFADWMTSPANPFFAKAIVNRIWAEMTGRGFVNPVDDFRASNPAVNEPLLDAIAEDFVKNGYDLKHLMRTIAASRIYQLSSLPNETNMTDTENFSRAYRRRLPAEVMAQAVAQVTGVPDEFQGLPGMATAHEAWNFKIKSDTLDAFGRPDSSSDAPCERNPSTSLVQALHLMHSDALQAKLSDEKGTVAKLAAGDATNEALVRDLYLTAFSREPDAEELLIASAAFEAEGATRQTAAEDIFWALLNSAEFVFNH